jgi:hypothetical protein
MDPVREKQVRPRAAASEALRDEPLNLYTPFAGSRQIREGLSDIEPPDARGAEGPTIKERLK